MAKGIVFVVAVGPHHGIAVDLLRQRLARRTSLPNRHAVVALIEDRAMRVGVLR